MTRLDPHSFADDAQPTADFLVWQARLDFATRVIDARAELRFPKPAPGGAVDFDTHDLSVGSVVDDSGQPLAYELGPPNPILGARLRIDVPAGARSVIIAYQTSPDGMALQWLGPRLTGDGRHPFLYTQCQPIHARSIVPVQDTPRTRLRFEAALDVPADLTVLMAGEAMSVEKQGERAVARFRMRQPISPYLFAFAVGAVASRDLGPRSRVWAEPGLLDAAAREFADTEALLAAGEELFGPYDWERYDMLVLPPAFPYGGMENPRLTFLTPSVIAGDRSLVSVVAHELAHSWMGNLVSNANAEHFWLNEGGATYAERRIVEAVWGADAAALDWALGRRQLEATMQHLDDEGSSALTRLRTELHGVDPDSAYSIVAYEKGALLLRALEEAVGRPIFDAFLRAYLQAFRFDVLTSEQFVAFAREHLPAIALAHVDIEGWLYQPGLPTGAPEFHSSRLETITALAGSAPSTDLAQSWSATEWQLYIESIPRPANPEFLAHLDSVFRLTASGNDDVLEKWLVLAIDSRYAAANPRVEDVLARVGRMKYLRALYRALANVDAPTAERLFKENAARYHPIARQVIANVLKSGADHR